MWTSHTLRLFCNFIAILLYIVRTYATSSIPPEQQLLQQVLLLPASSLEASAATNNANGNNSNNNNNINAFAVLHKSLQLEYGIFHPHDGRSSLRDDVVRSSDHPIWWMLKKNQDITKTTRAALCLLMGHGDVAHEVLLGVSLENIETAEYAAQHPGQTSWMDDHPLSDMDDILHSILHRCEGDSIGEGGHTGWDNAKYWAAGGPKAIEEFEWGNGSSSSSSSEHIDDDDNTSCSHHTTPQRQVLHQALVHVAYRYAPRCVAQGVVVPCHNKNRYNDSNSNSSSSNNNNNVSSNEINKKRHRILAAGGTRRTVQVHAGAWDPFRVIDLCASKDELDEKTRMELECLLEWELRLLLRYEILSMRQAHPVDAKTLLGKEEMSVYRDMLHHHSMAYE